MSHVSSASARLRSAVAYAVTGVEMPTADAPSEAPFDPERLIRDLGGVAVLREVAARARAAAAPWPGPVPGRLRDGLGAAQLHAAVERVRSLIDEPKAATIRHSDRPDADDLRLLRDVPPHHGT